MRRFIPVRAFSLVEMLLVMAVLGVVTSLSVPAFNKIFQARGLEKAGGDIMGILETARAHAMANNTVVWVGFKGSATSDDLFVGTVASRNGETSPLPQDLIQIIPTKKFSNIRVQSLADDASRPSPGLQLANSSSAILPFSTSGPQQVTFDTQVVQFSSRGEMRVVPNQLSKSVEIGLIEAVNGKPRNPANYAAIQMQGLSGGISLYRPKM